MDPTIAAYAIPCGVISLIAGFYFGYMIGLKTGTTRAENHAMNTLIQMQICRWECDPATGVRSFAFIPGATVKAPGAPAAPTLP